MNADDLGDDQTGPTTCPGFVVGDHRFVHVTPGLQHRIVPGGDDPVLERYLAEGDRAQKVWKVSIWIV